MKKIEKDSIIDFKLISQDPSSNKFIAVFLITILCAFFTNIPTSKANMFNKFKKGFYFEKYKSAEGAKSELLKLHPIGSEAESLIRRLENTGATIIRKISKDDVALNGDKDRNFFKIVDLLVEPNHYKSYYVKIPDSTQFVSVYECNVGVVNPSLWRMWVWYDKNNIITEFDLVKNYMGL